MELEITYKNGKTIYYTLKEKKKDHNLAQLDIIKKELYDRYKSYAKRRGGSLLSEKYHSAYIPMRFSCVLGHIFLETPYNIKNRDKWCVECGKYL